MAHERVGLDPELEQVIGVPRAARTPPTPRARTARARSRSGVNAVKSCIPDQRASALRQARPTSTGRGQCSARPRCSALRARPGQHQVTCTRATSHPAARRTPRPPARTPAPPRQRAAARSALDRRPTARHSYAPDRAHAPRRRSAPRRSTDTSATRSSTAKRPLHLLLNRPPPGLPRPAREPTPVVLEQPTRPALARAPVLSTRLGSDQLQQHHLARVRAPRPELQDPRVAPGPLRSTAARSPRTACRRRTCPGRAPTAPAGGRADHRAWQA